MVSCEPVDSFTVVAKCDALEAEAEVLCEYNKTVGTKWTDETKGHMDISAEIYAAIRVGTHA